MKTFDEENVKSIEIISSKSDAHRAYICAALSDGDCEVICNETSQDIEATRNCMVALMNLANDRVGADLYCKESGSTLRFLLPIVGALGKRGIFHPMGRLSKRPLSPLYEELVAHGMTISEPGSVPLIAEGKLKGGDFHIKGNVSSQFISGLLFALPLLNEDSRIIVEGELESAGYVDMTLKTLERFGIKVNDEAEEDRRVFTVPGNQEYTAPKEYVVEGDWSNSAFWLAAGILGESPVRIHGLRLDTAQGDAGILKVIQDFGGEVTIDCAPEQCEQKQCAPERSESEHCAPLNCDSSNPIITTYPSAKKLKAITYDAAQTPDMVPAVALIATQAKGTTKIINAERLRTKESDRLHSISAALRGLGAHVEELEDGLIIKGSSEALSGGTVESFGDHRIAMMVAVASLICRDKARLIGWDAVDKSYPSFYEHMDELGLSNNLERV